MIDPINRRELFRACGASMIYPAMSRIAFFQDPPAGPADVVTESQSGDPDAPSESVTFSPSAIRRLAKRGGKATFEKWSPSLPMLLISSARQFIGSSRTSTPAQISELLELFNLPLKTND